MGVSLVGYAMTVASGIPLEATSIQRNRVIRSHGRPFAVFRGCHDVTLADVWDPSCPHGSEVPSTSGRRLPTSIAQGGSRFNRPIPRQGVTVGDRKQSRDTVSGLTDRTLVLERLSLFHERCWIIGASVLVIDGGNGYARSHQSAAVHGKSMEEACQRDTKVLTWRRPVGRARLS